MFGNRGKQTTTDGICLISVQQSARDRPSLIKDSRNFAMFGGESTAGVRSYSGVECSSTRPSPRHHTHTYPSHIHPAIDTHVLSGRLPGCIERRCIMGSDAKFEPRGKNGRASESRVRWGFFFSFFSFLSFLPRRKQSLAAATAKIKRTPGSG